MTERVSDESPNIFPVLRYRDARAAMGWLVNVLGFESVVDVPTPGGGGGVAHAELSLGPGAIMLATLGGGGDPANPWSAVRHGVYVYVADVDGHYARAQSAGAEIARAIEDTAYGSREFSVRDPEGFLWSFGNYRPEGRPRS
jgi:uncharacterized glyoxalase superfamily protein PhnB